MMTDEARAQKVYDEFLGECGDVLPQEDYPVLIRLVAAALAAVREDCAKDARDMAELVIETWEANQNMIAEDEYQRALAIRTGP